MNIRLKLKIIEQFRTQADFAMEIGGNESLVSRVIRGRRVLPAEKKEQWAKVLKCESREIFS